MFGRRTKSTLQSSLSNPAPSARDTTTSSTVKEAKEGRKANHLDKHRRHLKQLCTGQQVHLKLLRPGEKEQQSAEMKKQLSSGNYDVEKLKEELCDATASSSELLAKPTPPDLTQTRWHYSQNLVCRINWRQLLLTMRQGLFQMWLCLRHQLSCARHSNHTSTRSDYLDWRSRFCLLSVIDLPYCMRVP